MQRKATPRRTADAEGGEDDEDRTGSEEEEEDDQHVLIYVKLLQLLPVNLMQDTTFILGVLAKDLRAGRGCPRSCRRPRHLCTPRLGSMPPCGNTCQSICGTGAASCSRRCGATASHLSMQPVRELCQTVSARLRHFSITSDRTNGRQRNPRRTMDIFGKKVNKTGRRKDDAVKAAQTEQEAAAAKQDGDERAESQPQRRRRCTGPRRPRTRTSCATFWRQEPKGTSASAAKTKAGLQG